MNRSTRTLLAIPLFFPLLAFAQQAIAPAGSVPSSRAAAPSQGSLQVDVVVTDKEGKAVPGLERSDFTVQDNNQPMNILSFQASGGTEPNSGPPVDVILLIDTVNVDFKYVSFVRQEIEKYLTRNGGHLAHPMSLLVYTNTGLDTGSGPTTDGNALAAEVSRLDNHLRSSDPGQGVNGAIDRFYASLKTIAAIAQSEALKPGKKLLIWTGPGWPMLSSARVEISPTAQLQNFNSIVGLSTVLRLARMSVYSIQSADSGSDATAYRSFLKGVKSAAKSDPDNLALKVLAVQSGGRVLGPNNNLADQIDHCVDDAAAFYTISYASPRADHANEYHDLKVVIGKPGLTARTNTGFYNQP